MLISAIAKNAIWAPEYLHPANEGCRHEKILCWKLLRKHLQSQGVYMATATAITAKPQSQAAATLAPQRVQRSFRNRKTLLRLKERNGRQSASPLRDVMNKRLGECMAKSLKQIEQQIAKLQREAEAIKIKEVAGVIERMKTAIAHYGLKPADLFEAKSAPAGSNGKSTSRKASPGPAPKKKQTVPVKYRDEHGNTWTSRGSQPRWLVAALQSGRKLEEFAVKPH